LHGVLVKGIDFFRECVAVAQHFGFEFDEEEMVIKIN
jgi:hypothetical protein